MANAVDFLNYAQAAAYLQIDIRTLGAWRSQGSGPCLYRFSARCVKYRRADLDRCLQQHRATTAGDGEWGKRALPTWPARPAGPGRVRMLWCCRRRIGSFAAVGR
jgi:hypothetical protein